MCCPSSVFPAKLKHRSLNMFLLNRPSLRSSVLTRLMASNDFFYFAVRLFAADQVVKGIDQADGLSFKRHVGGSPGVNPCPSDARDVRAR